MGTVSSYVFKNLRANHTIAANFTATALPTFIITATAGAGGSITPSGNVSVDSGANQAFLVIVGTGYQIADVLVDGASVGAVANYTFHNVVADHTLTASFKLIPTGKLVIAASAGDGGSISPNGGIEVDSGTSQAFAITANTGHLIANVLVDGVSVGAVATYKFENVTANHTIAASF